MQGWLWWAHTQGRDCPIMSGCPSWRNRPAMRRSRNAAFRGSVYRRMNRYFVDRGLDHRPEATGACKSGCGGRLAQLAI